MNGDAAVLANGMVYIVAFILILVPIVVPTVALIVTIRKQKREKEEQASSHVEHEVELRTRQMMLIEQTRTDVAVVKETVEKQSVKLDELAKQYLLVEKEVSNQKKAVWRKIEEISKFAGMPAMIVDSREE